MTLLIDWQAALVAAAATLVVSVLIVAPIDLGQQARNYLGPSAAIVVTAVGAVLSDWRTAVFAGLIALGIVQAAMSRSKMLMAELLVSIKTGRTRELYFNVVPIQLIYDRWTTEYSRFWASHVTDVKFNVEGKRHAYVTDN